MSVARFIADQRTFYRVPHAFTCRVLAVSEAWFYKLVKARPPIEGNAGQCWMRRSARRSPFPGPATARHDP